MENYIHFWHDLWCGEQSLKEAFPLLYETLLTGRHLWGLCWWGRLEGKGGVGVYASLRSRDFNDWQVDQPGCIPFIFWSLIFLGYQMEIRCDGGWRTMGSLILALFMVCWGVLLSLSLRRVFWVWRSQSECFSLFGRWLGEDSYLWQSSKERICYSGLVLHVPV